MPADPQVLFVENHDSFSWNVIDCLPVGRACVQVVRASEGVEHLWRAQVLVIGPGPTDPQRAGLIELVREAGVRRVPTLGICLGHQALGLAFGAKLVSATPAHGKTGRVRFGRSRRFPGVEGELEAMRYHSLALEEVGAPLEVVGRLEDGTVMAVEHTGLPMAGLQFHPDSYGTPRGRELVAAFFRSLE